jgi:hypothetical protein
MGKIELDHTGAGSGITLSSDGTDLLLDGTAIGGGGGTALELYVENPVTFTAPTATGDNAVAIGAASDGTGSVSSGAGSFATSGGVASNSQAQALGKSYASGNQAFAAAIANNTATYGATGSNSVAIGTVAKSTGIHSVAIGNNSVSSGTGSVALGQSASATASSAVAIGLATTSSSTGSFAIGSNASASNIYATVIGGNSNTASNAYAIVTGGRSNTSSSTYSRTGGYYATSGGITGKDVWASGRLSAQGDAQTGTLVLRGGTTDATASVLTSTHSSASTINQVILPNNSAYAFHGTIVARQKASDGTASAAWKVEGLIRREANAASTVLVNSALTVLDNTPAWGLALTADTTNGGLKIEVTGAAATNIRWVATINTSEVTYA